MRGLTHLEAVHRAHRGWDTRRHGHVVQSRGKHYWVRPNRERVKLTGFTEPHIRALKPALIATDTHLKTDIHLDTQIKLAKRGELEGLYRRGGGSKKAQVGALTHSPQLLFKRQIVSINPQTFTNKSMYDPGGVLAHELGHIIGPKKHTAQDFQLAFGYKGKNLRKPETWRHTSHNEIRNLRTRQGLNAHEDFAESFRHLVGLPITKTYSPIFHTQVNSAREGYFRKHYLR